VVKKTSKATGSRASGKAKRKRAGELTHEQEHILREAMCYCLHHFPMLWTTGGVPEERRENGLRRWVVRIYLRYPTGHEGYLGDLLYDGKQFSEMTDRELMRERAREIEADPALQREWDEYRASTLPARDS
jgi:hypothetical protein